MISTSNYNSIPISDCIIEAKSELELSEGTLHDADMYNWAQKALMQMGGLQTMKIKNVKLDIVDGQADLPSDMLKFLALRFCDKDGVGYGVYFGDYNFLSECNCNVNGELMPYGSLVMINDNKIIFRSSDEIPEAVTLAYRGSIVDENGFVSIYPYMSNAIVAYICFRFCKKFMHVNRYAVKLQEWKSTWKAEHDRVVSFGAHQSFQNNQSVARRMTHPLIIAL